MESNRSVFLRMSEEYYMDIPQGVRESFLTQKRVDEEKGDWSENMKDVCYSLLYSKYKKLKKGDTLTVQFQSTIKSVCKKKGCWMNMELGEGNKSFVKFEDYAFFVPLNADNSEAIVSGKAFIQVESIKDLRHYAKDAGKSSAEIAKIITPETTFSFMADGVYIKK